MANMTIRKGTYPTYSPDINFVAGASGQYTITATVTNSNPFPLGASAQGQVLFYWAQAATPQGLSAVAPPQLYGWSLPAYIQATTPPFSNPTSPTPLLSPTQSAQVTTLWTPDANVGASIANSFDPAHIMIIAQVITVGVSGHPVDFNWFPPATSSPWTAAAIFSWPV